MCIQDPPGRRHAGNSDFDDLWVILLAAGDGNRVRDLTRDQDGVHVPKQFCAPDGSQSMVRWAIRRAARLAPMERIVPVVAAQHRRWWKDEFPDIPRCNLVIQPGNRGTAVGILLPLVQILQRDPDARVLVLPSDHYVENEDILQSTLIKALDSVEMEPSRVVLVGMPARKADTEYGWILPLCSRGDLCRVGAFVEKPDSGTARTLKLHGGILNSFIIAASGDALLRLYPRSMSDLVGEVVAWQGSETAGWPELATLYQTLSATDFSTDVLQRSCSSLSVVRARACGWTDLGTPERLRHHWRKLSTVRGQAPDAGSTRGYERSFGGLRR